ncbi:MAG: hypothetical protein JEZ14_12750 [Marinilabiliaceae bacterium]|nr:hypothetical protein [Marinilabiliaceae bacterium]
MLVAEHVTNTVTEVNFASENINAYTVRHVTDYFIGKRSIVVNMGDCEIYVDEQPQKGLAPRQSTVLRNKIIKAADLILVLEVQSKVNIGNVILSENWDSAQSLFGEPLAGIPLWKSPQVEIGETELNPYEILNQCTSQKHKVKFKIKVNIWFATPKTNCAIHNQHDFIEFHTQIMGIGRMQKFDTNKTETLYQDVILAEGNTHNIFCDVYNNGYSYNYPWHQYYSDTDCIWMATELHPVPITN